MITHAAFPRTLLYCFIGPLLRAAPSVSARPCGVAIAAKIWYDVSTYRKEDLSLLYLALALFTAAIVAVDQLTKYLAAAHLVGRTITLIPGWLQLHYITNDGMALSLLRGARWLFVVMTAVYLAVVVYVLVKKWFKKTPELWCIAAITGGAIGNFIDRISSGLVIDMICIPWFSTFNVADLFITFGALILVVYILVKDKALLADEPKKKPEAGHDADAR